MDRARQHRHGPTTEAYLPMRTGIRSIHTAYGNLMPNVVKACEYAEEYVHN
jgi:hypothetical protein